MNRSRWTAVFSGFSVLFLVWVVESGLLPATIQAQSKPVEILVYQQPG